MRGFRTDLAMERVDEERSNLEGIRIATHHMGSIEHTHIHIDQQEAADRLGRPCGEYITIACKQMAQVDAVSKQHLQTLVAHGVTSLLPKEGDVLVVGLGNRNVTADALGTRVVERMLVTRHLREALPEGTADKVRAVSAIAPGVLGLTGIETAELCRGLVAHVKPCAVVVIDALAAYESDRICTTVQITNTGIEPGSGVGNHRLGLTKETLGVKVIAIGVPMVVYASTIARDAMTHLMQEYHLAHEEHPNTTEALLTKLTEGFLQDMVVTPREIDEMVVSIADLLSESINEALQPAIDKETLHTLVH